MRIKHDPPGGTRMKVLLLANGTQEQTTGKLASALAVGLRHRGHAVSLALRPFPKGLFPKVRALVRAEARDTFRVLRNDVVVIHSALSLSLATVVVARLLRRPVVAFVWDLYPQSTRIAGNITHPWLLRLFAWMESLGYRLATTIAVPSKDYVPALAAFSDKVVVRPLWPTQRLAPAALPTTSQSILRLGFAGQINAIRGMESTIDMVVEALSGAAVELHVFGRDALPARLADRVDGDPRLQVTEHGFLHPDALASELASLDLGWVCLDEGFDLPAFPSKTWTYLAAGLPILYTGPEMPGLEEWLATNGFGVCLRRGNDLALTDVSALRSQLVERRDAYVARMEGLWFSLDSLL